MSGSRESGWRRRQRQDTRMRMMKCLDVALLSVHVWNARWSCSLTSAASLSLSFAEHGCHVRQFIVRRREQPLFPSLSFGRKLIQWSLVRFFDCTTCSPALRLLTRSGSPGGPSSAAFSSVSFAGETRGAGWLLHYYPKRRSRGRLIRETVHPGARATSLSCRREQAALVRLEKNSRTGKHVRKRES